MPPDRYHEGGGKRKSPRSHAVAGGGKIEAMSVRALRAMGFAILLVLPLAGCASWEGAHLYRSGTAALDRGEPERAILDLERAA